MTTTTKPQPPPLDCPDIGKEMPLTDEDTLLIEQARKEREALPEDKRLEDFTNIITKSGWCGFANGGNYDYILNTNPRKSYVVTINTDWRQGIFEGSYIETHRVPAGGKVLLGCTRNSSVQVTFYFRKVVGEE